VGAAISELLTFRGPFGPWLEVVMRRKRRVVLLWDGGQDA
jgi:hypothetical protein